MASKRDSSASRNCLIESYIEFIELAQQSFVILEMLTALQLNSGRLRGEKAARSSGELSQLRKTCTERVASRLEKPG